MFYNLGCYKHGIVQIVTVTIYPGFGMPGVKMINVFPIDFQSIDRKKIIKLREGLPECVAACDRVLKRLDKPDLRK